MTFKRTSAPQHIVISQADTYFRSFVSKASNAQLARFMASMSYQAQGSITGALANLCLSADCELIAREMGAFGC